MLADEAVDEKATAFMGGENMNNLANSNWKIRLAAMEMVEQEIKRTPKEDMQTQAIVRIIGSKKPGLKDNNFQVLKLRLSSLAYLAENFNFSWTSAECIISDLVDKIGDVKNGQGCKDVLTAAAEATEFPKVAELVISTAFEGKNPKNQSESLNWLAQAIYNFGFKVNIKPLVGSIKKALAATNPAVRQSAITLLGVCYMYMGATLRVLFEDEKPALLVQIDAGFEKVKGQAPPAPTRGLKGAGDAGGDEEEADGDDEAPVEDLLPRNDISGKVSDGLLSKLSDKSWKIRKEGLDEVIAILTEAKFITDNLGGLTEALKLRLADSNKILVNTTLGILKTVAVASGPNCKRHVPILAGPLLVTLGDSKPMVRQAATQTLEAWVEQTKLAPFVEAGVFGDSLRTENPNLRSTLLNWISPKLKEHQKKLPVELKECIPPLLACLNDRNPDVRKAAQEAILPFMMQTGFDSMLKAASKVDKSSKDAVVALLEKAKGELPSKPKKVQSVPVVQSHISSNDIDDIINDRDLQTEDTASKPAAKAVKGGSGKAAPGKKAAGVRGKLNDKDLSMLENRIKSASRAKHVAVVPPEPSTSSPKTSGSRRCPSTVPSQSQAAPRTSGNPPQPNRPSTAGTSQVRPTLPPEFTITTTWQPLPKEVVLNEIDQKLLDELTQPFPVPVLKIRTVTSASGRNQQSHLLEQSPDAKSVVEMTVTNIASSNLQMASNSLSQLSYTMSEPRHKELLKSSTDQIIMMITLQLKQLHTRHFMEGLNPRDDNSIDEAFRLHAMCTTLLVEMTEKDLMIQTSVEVFKDFVHQAISGVLDPKLDDYPQGPVTISNLCKALSKVLLSGNATNTLCAPLSLLHDCAGPALQCTDSFTELIQKCIWRKIRHFSSQIVQLEMDPILKLCNAFFNDYPSAYWRGKAFDKPLKTVKIVVATLIHMAPERVYTAISMATYSPKAELESYITRHMAKLNKSNTTAAGHNTIIGQSPGKLAQFIHNSLDAIFKKIGSRENSKEGIMELYQFREQYPDVSLEPFLKKHSSFFQMYIQRGLQNIEDEKKKEAASAVSSRCSADNYQRDRVHGEVDWDEKLRKHRDWMKRLGIGNISSCTGNLLQPVSRPPDVVLGTRTSNVMEDVLPRETTAQRAAPAASTPPHRKLMDRLERLIARLERVEKCQHKAEILS